MQEPEPPKKILVVDDDRDLAEAVEIVLMADGFDVAVAHNGRQALEILRRDQQWSMVLLDLMMPVMNGWEFRVEQIKDSRLAEIPVVAFSGGVNVQEEGGPAGVAALLKKPVTREALLAMVHRLCDSAAP